MDAPKFDKRRLPSRHVTEGPERAPHRSYYYAMGLTRGRDPPAVRRRRHLLERGRALQHRAEPPGAGGEARGQGGDGHAARVHHHHRHRRHRHGPRGDALEPRQPRRDRRHRRADHARALLRRDRRARRLRQELAGDDDGDGPPQRAVGVHLRRLDPAGAGAGRGGRAGGLRRPRPDRAGHVRGGRPPPGRHARQRGAGDPRACRLPERRRLRRAVHRQHHGLRLRGDRPRAPQLVGRAGALREPRRLCDGERRRGDAAPREEHPRPRRGDAEEPRERGAGRRLHRRLDQRRAAPAGDRARGGDRVHARGRLRHLPRHPLLRRPEAGRQVRGQGSLRGRRRAGGAEGAGAGRAAPPRLHDRERPHASARSSTTSAARPTGG